MKKITVVIYGAPGSGKTIQADLLSRRENFILFDIGHFLETTFNDPTNKNNQEIMEQKKIFDAGGLCDSLWVTALASKKFEEIAKLGENLVLSGSLRTVLETFGHEKMKGLLNVLETNYGKENIFFFFLETKTETSIQRNTARLLCSVCGRPVLMDLFKGKPKACPVCGGPLAGRSLDKPEVIKKRLLMFQSEINPVLEGLKSKGYKIHSISGERLPYETNNEIIQILKNELNKK